MIFGKKRLLTSVLLMSALTVGCGGSSSSNDSSEADTKSVVSMFITDNLADDYDKVWVTVKSVSLIADNGTEVSLYSDETGQVYNLAELAGVGELLASTAVDPGTYTSIEVTLDDEVSLVDGDGNTITAHFNNTGSDHELTVPASLVVTTEESGSLALDFDLANFEYDADTGLVTPDVKVKDEDEVADLDQVVARVKGEVTELVDADSFVMKTHRRHGATEVSVDLAANATITDEETGTTLPDLSTLEDGEKVHVAGNFDPATRSIEAISVVIHHDDDEDEHNSDGSLRRAEIEGVLASFDGSNATIDIRDANFVPPSDSLPVAGLANAHFVRGSLAELEVGQSLEIRGLWDGNTFTAWLVKVEGASEHSGKVVELKGEIVSFVDNMLTVDVMQHNTAGGTLGSPVTFDATNVFIKKGRLSCLEAGAYVKVMGSLDEGTFYPALIEFKSKCAALGRPDEDDDHDDEDEGDDGDEHEDDDSDDGDHDDANNGDDDDDEDHGGHGNRAKVEGTITAINGDIITLMVVEARGPAKDLTTVNADISDARVKHDESMDDLAVGAYVEVYGVLDGDTLKAVMLEIDD